MEVWDQLVGTEVRGPTVTRASVHASVAQHLSERLRSSEESCDGTGHAHYMQTNEYPMDPRHRAVFDQWHSLGFFFITCVQSPMIVKQKMLSSRCPLGLRGQPLQMSSAASRYTDFQFVTDGHVARAASDCFVLSTLDSRVILGSSHWEHSHRRSQKQPPIAARLHAADPLAARIISPEAATNAPPLQSTRVPSRLHQAGRVRRGGSG